MSEEKPMKKGTSSITVFAIGAVIGAGVALLYAPCSGKETRKMLAKKGKQLRGKAEDALEGAKEFVKDRKADLADALDTVKGVADDVKGKHHRKAA